MNTQPVLAFVTALSLWAGACGSSPSVEPRESTTTPTHRHAEPTPSTRWPVAASPTPLAAAHEALLDGEHVVMFRHLRTLLADPTTDAANRRNALALLEAAYEDTRGKLPAPVELPQALRHLSVESIMKTEPDRLRYRLVLRGWAHDHHEITDIRLLHGPHDTLVLEQSSGLGTYDAHVNDEGFEFELEGPEVSSPVAEGLYHLSMNVDGEPVSLWFIVSGLNSSATPILRHPIAGQSLATTQPVLTWESFRSPEHKAFEQRALSVWMSRLDSPGPAWTLWTDQEIESAQVGQHPRGRGVDALRPGSHWLALTYSEARHQGAITLKRLSRTALPFRVLEEAR